MSKSVFSSSDIYPLSDIFHSFPKYTVIHQLEEVFLEVILGILTLFSIEINILLQPRRLIELKYSMDFSNLQTKICV